MDSISQIVLGAAVGEATLGKKVGNKAALWGGIAGTIPDLDVFANFFMGQFDATIAHRGVSHSILFCVVMAPIMGWLLNRIYRGRDGTSAKDWTRLMFWGLFTHPLLDSFTSWGTQLFYPFSDYRVAFNSIFVADPMYTVPFLLCLIVALCLRRDRTSRRVWNWIGIGISSFYLLLTLVNKLTVTDTFRNALHAQGKSIVRLSTYPSPLNNILWYTVAEEPSGYDIGYYSLLGNPKAIRFQFVPKNHHLIEGMEDNRVIEGLRWMSKDYFSVESINDTLYWHDMRFGLMSYAPIKPGERPPYVFTYTLLEEDGEIVEIYSGEPEIPGSASEAFNELWNKIKGN